MVPAIEEPFVTRPFCLRFAMIGALAAAFLLSACGRKGPLDPPPGGWEIPMNPGMTTHVSRTPAAPAPPEYDAEGKPIAPVGPKRRLPGDVLLD